MKTILLTLFAAVLVAQTPGAPPMEPGDVAFMDPSTNAAYLIWHAKTGELKAVYPYSPERVYWLLLQREQAAWDAFAAYGDSTKVQPSTRGKAK